ncbi:MAG TPA: Ig-like domain-containing protein, partial [Actinomycetota bacterium]|nr:Ig-like domain-containing protein [Actinomycetota bacterium]
MRSPSLSVRALVSVVLVAMLVTAAAPAAVAQSAGDSNVGSSGDPAPPTDDPTSGDGTDGSGEEGAVEADDDASDAGAPPAPPEADAPPDPVEQTPGDDAASDPAAAPSVTSDKPDYAPGELVTLTGVGWAPGETVHVEVDDNVGRTWTRAADVVARDDGTFEDAFTLPNWFVATYDVVATGAESGVARTSFTDAAVNLEGQSNPPCSSGGGCSGGWQSGNLTGWKELQDIPMRLRFTATGAYTVVVEFDHTTTSGNVPGIQNLYNWAAGAGVTLTSAPTLTDSTGPKWGYTVPANVTTAGAVVAFKANLAAGAHNFTGSSLAMSADNGGGTVQVSKPGAAPGSPDLAVTKSGPTSASPGSTITYTLNYQNRSSAANAATGVQLTDFLPAGVNYVAGSCSGTCTVTGNEVSWVIGNLAIGASGSRTLQVTIPSGASFGTSYTNQARVLSAENDANMADNTSSLTTTVSFNRNPSATNDSITTAEDTAGAVNVLANDSDPDGNSLSVTGNTQPSNGSASCAAGGSCTYTPNANFNGSDSFDYTVSDGNGGTATGTVNVNVTPVNDAPSAQSQNVNADEDTPKTITLQGSDAEGSALSFSIVGGGPSHGSLGAIGTPSCTGNTCTAQVTYTPAANYNGPDSFQFKVHDGSLDSSNATVGISVAGSNDAPVAADDDAGSTPEDTAKDIASSSLLANDTDADGDSLSIASVGGATHGSVSLSGDGTTVTFTPDSNYNGPASFTYRASDGALQSNAATVSLSVTAANDAPNARDDAIVTNEDTVGAVDVLANDDDADGDSLSVTAYDQPAHGVVTCGAAGSCTYSPASNFDGDDSFEYTISDGNGGSDTATVDVTVVAVNDAPSAQSQNVDADEDTPKTITLEGSDVEGSPLSFSIVGGGPSHGSLGAVGAPSCSGTTCTADVTYTPAADYDGPDSFDFKVSDGSLDSSNATVTIDVAGSNDAPVAHDDSYDGVEDEARDIAASSLVSNDDDVDGDALSVSAVGSATHGSVALSGDGATVTFTPAGDFNGDATFSYTVSDGNGGSDSGDVTIDFAPVNDRPSAADGDMSVA